MLLVIDNYDSFTFNLVQYLGELGADVVVRRNDAIELDEIASLRPEGMLLSPGPGRPEGAGISLQCVERFASEFPILGVCLGHQTIAQALGARIVRARRLMHGRTSPIHHDGQGVFTGLPDPFVATRYHSLIVEPSSLPSSLVATAWSDDDELMGVRHRDLPLTGLQFHPESFLTEHGHAVLRRFLESLPGRGAR